MGYEKISEVLVDITNNVDENADTRSEAEGIVKKMMRLEYGFLTDLWATLLNGFNSVNVALQSSSLDLNNAVALLESLGEYVKTLHEQFEIFEENGKALSGFSEYVCEYVLLRHRVFGKHSLTLTLLCAFIYRFWSRIAQESGLFPFLGD